MTAITKKEIFLTHDALMVFLQPMLDEKKWIIDVKQEVENGPYIVEWQEHKFYTSLDGKEYHDEVWRTKDDRLILVQDLTEDHCRNILRMILRQEREADDSGEQLRQQLILAIKNGELENIMDDFGEASNVPYQIPGSNTLQ